MPSHIVAALNAKHKLPHKKLIKKEAKISRQNCSSTPSDYDSIEDTTTSEPSASQTQCQSAHNLQRITRLVKFANFRFKYSIDTYLVCLNILNNLRFEIHESKIKLIAAAVILIAGKVHEFRTPKFVDLIRWGEFQFKSGDLIQAEAELLVLLKFKVPVAIKYSSIKAIEQEVEKLESKIHSQSFLFQ